MSLTDTEGGGTRTLPPPLDFLGAPVTQLPGYDLPEDRALPAWATEDRISYWRAQQQIQQSQIPTIQFNQNGPDYPNFSDPSHDEGVTPAWVSPVGREGSEIQPAYDYADSGVVTPHIYAQNQIGNQRRALTQVQQQQAGAEYNATRGLSQPLWDMRPPQTTQAQRDFGQGIADQGNGSQFEAWKQRLGPKGAAALNRVVLAPAPGSDGGWYSAESGQIAARPEALIHEVAHAYESIYLTPDEQRRFIATVVKLVQGGNPLALQLTQSRNDETAGRNTYNGLLDPAHVFTAFAVNELTNPGTMPKELQPFFDGLLKPPAKTTAQSQFEAGVARNQPLQNPGPYTAPPTPTRAQVEATPQFQAIQRAQQAVAPLQRTANTYAGIASGRIDVRQPNEVYAADYSSPQAVIDEAQRRADAAVKDVRVIWPNQDETPAQGFAAGAGEALGVAGKVIGSTLGAPVPGASAVQDVAGKIAQASVLPYPTDFIPGLDTRDVRKRALAAITEAVIPTHVWDTALTIFPATKARTPIELASAVLLGDTGALDALRSAGRKLGETDAVEELVKALSSEKGALKLGPEEQAAQVVRLQEQRKNINEALKVLTVGDRASVGSKGLQGVFTVATRYEAGSAERAALGKAAEPLIEHLPEADKKFIRASLDTLPSRAQRKAATAAQRTRQFVSAQQAYDETPGTVAEKTIASFKAKGGQQAQQFTPVGDRFSDQETADLFERIQQAADDGKIGRVFDRDNAVSALTLLMTGERLPGVRSEALKSLNLAPHEIKLLGKVFGPEFTQAIPRSAEHMSRFQRFIDILNLPRALITAIDISAAGRQGILLAARNPVEVAKAFPSMFKAMASEEGFQRAAGNIQRNRHFEDALKHGLDITDIGGGASAEEPFISSLASKIPGVKASERGFVTYLDTLRMLTYEKNATRAERLAAKQGWNVERLDLAKTNVAKFLNHASGRGDLGALGEYTPAMNAVFFSPKFLASRFQSVWDMVRPGADSFSRQVAFENLGAFVASGVGMLEAAKLMGADVEIDPRSSDFGKMRFGNTRVDFWGGYQPIARYLAQIGSAHIKDATTGEVGFANPGESATRFFRSKFSPAGAAIYDYLPGKQKDYQGNDLLIPLNDLTANHGLNKDAGALAWNTFATKLLPLSIQDAVAGYRSGGLSAGLVAGGVSALGGGTSSFGASEKQQKTLATSDFEKSVLQPSGARLNGKQVWPTVLDKDWSNKPWQDLFHKEFAELGDTTRFKSVAEMRKAYIEYWWQKIGDVKGVGEKQTKTDYGNAFDGTSVAKQWADNVKSELLNYYKRNPEALRRAVREGHETLNDEERKILKIAP